MSEKQRVALVTGAAAGIGQACCRTLAETGMHIAGLDIADQDETAAQVRAVGGSYVPVAADVRDEQAVAAACTRVLEAFGALHVLVNNAGVYPVKPFLDTELDDWRQVMSLNLDGVFVVTRTALPHMINAGWGRVVLMSSSTVWLGVPGMVPYVTSKMGLIGFTRALAAEVGEHGITVNAITPGLVETETALAGAVGENFDWVVSSQAVKRRQRPEDLASTLRYICDEGSDLLTGQTLNVDGGFAKH